MKRFKELPDFIQIPVMIITLLVSTVLLFYSLISIPIWYKTAKEYAGSRVYIEVMYKGKCLNLFKESKAFNLKKPDEVWLQMNEFPIGNDSVTGAKIFILKLKDKKYIERYFER